MYFEVLPVLFFLSGFFMKISDDLFDISNNKLYSSIFGIFCAVASAFATILNSDAACIFIGILIGNLLAFKIDGMHHIFTLIIFTILVIVLGIPQLSLVILLVCILAALIDEIGHELVSKKINNIFVNLFFEYRFTMKVVLFILAIFGIFNFWVFICFLIFEISYELAGFCYKKINLIF